MLVHLNGELIDHNAARVSVFDRGFLFGDGVYEGLRTTADDRGAPRLIGAAHHQRRLEEGLAESRIRGFDPAALESMTEALVRANGLVEAFIYWQITRGTPPGGAGPARPRVTKASFRPTVVGFAMEVPAVESYAEPEAKRCALIEDTRWLRGRLKSISLLGNVIAAYEADEAGADDAVLMRDGLVSEGTATNVFLAKRGRLITPSIESAPMLAGVTRELILAQDPSIESRPVGVEELREADEIMLVGTKTMVASVVMLDGTPVGSGSVGPSARGLLATLRAAIARDIHASSARLPQGMSNRSRVVQ